MSRFYSRLSERPIRLFDNYPAKSWALFLIRFYSIHVSSYLSSPVRPLTALFLQSHVLGGGGAGGTQDCVSVPKKIYSFLSLSLDNVQKKDETSLDEKEETSQITFSAAELRMPFWIILF